MVFDTEIFGRGASLVATKRESLAPDAVLVLADDIVWRLASIGAVGPSFETPSISGDSIAAFCNRIIQTSPDAAFRFIEDRRAERVTRQGGYLGYIIAAVRSIGQGWDEDRYSFHEVTYGTGHLYALMRALRAETSRARPAFDGRRCALFATAKDQARAALPAGRDPCAEKKVK